MTAGYHKRVHALQTIEKPCVVCDDPVYLAGFTVENGRQVKVKQEYGKVIGLECITNLVQNYHKYLSLEGLPEAEQERLKNLEIENQEYLEELERMVPL